MVLGKILSSVSRTQYFNSLRFASTKVAVVGASISKGQPKEGVQNGPQVIRQTGFIERLKETGVQVTDHGDITPSWQVAHDKGPNGELNFNSVLSFNKDLAETIADLKKTNDICLTLGGDHSLGIGSVKGHSDGAPDKKIHLLWVDAHPDINTGKTSPSGNMHGMTLSFLLKELDQQSNKFGEERWPTPCLSGNQVAFIGLRDVDPDEKILLKELGIKYFTTRDIDSIGINEVISRSFDHFNMKQGSSLHVSFDIDSLDPSLCPSTGTPVPGGLSLREGMTIVETALDSGFLGGFDLVEVNPSIGSQNDVKTTKSSAFSIIMAGIAGHRGT